MVPVVYSLPLDASLEQGETLATRGIGQEVAWPEAVRQSKTRSAGGWLRYRWSALLRGVGRRIYPFGVAVVCVLVPRRRWYGVLFRVSGWLAWAVRCVRPERDRTLHARILDQLLILMTLRGGGFPIPVRSVGKDLLEELAGEAIRKQGVVFCSGHLPLVRLFLKEIVECRRFRLVAISAAPESEDGAVVIPGGEEMLPLMVPDGRALIRARSVLRSGGALAALLDGSMCQPPISTNVMQVVRRVGARILMGTCELEKDGTILLRFLNPPAPKCETDAGIEENARFLSEQIQKVVG